MDVSNIFRSRFKQGKINGDEVLRMYRAITVLQLLHKKAMGIYLLYQSFMSQVFLVLIISYTILCYEQIGVLCTFLSVSIALFLAAFIILVTKAATLLTANSRRFLQLYESVGTDIRERKDILRQRERKVVFQTLKPIFVYIGQFYFIDPGTRLEICKIVVDNVISLILMIQ